MIDNETPTLTSVRLASGDVQLVRGDGSVAYTIPAALLLSDCEGCGKPVAGGWEFCADCEREYRRSMGRK